MSFINKKPMLYCNTTWVVEKSKNGDDAAFHSWKHHNITCPFWQEKVYSYTFFASLYSFAFSMMSGLAFCV